MGASAVGGAPVRALVGLLRRPTERSQQRAGRWAWSRLPGEALDGRGIAE